MYRYIKGKAEDVVQKESLLSSNAKDAETEVSHPIVTLNVFNFLITLINKYYIRYKRLVHMLQIVVKILYIT